MSDREDFEEAASRLGYNLTMAEHETGEYHYRVTQDAWDMWQEAKDQAARAQGGEAVAWRNPEIDSVITAKAYRQSIPGAIGGYTQPLYAHCNDFNLGAEDMAKTFHELYERLAPKYGYVTREGTRNFDPDSPNGKLMIAVCKDMITGSLNPADKP